MKIICIAGLIGSGKDEVAKYISDKYGYEIIDYANILREIVRNEGLEVTRENLQNTRLKYGNTFLAEIVIKKIKESEKQKIILTPMRRSEDYLIPKKEFGSNMQMILVEVSAKVRFKRLSKRGRENDPKDFTTFKKQEKREFEIFNFKKTFSYADFKVNNNGNMNQLRIKIDDVMKKIDKSEPEVLLRQIVHPHSPRKFIIMGPQGSGKGTHAERLAKEMSILHVSSGDLLRDVAQQNTKQGKEIKHLLTTGKLLSDELVFDLLKKRLSKKDASKGYIIDGFPRNIKQTKTLEKTIEIDKVIYLNVSDKECLRRLSGRTQCEKCKAIYGNENQPKIKGKCDQCGGSLYVREDDKESVIKTRLKVYHDQTEPILDLYRKNGKLVEIKINGIKQPDEVFTDILKALGM